MYSELLVHPESPKISEGHPAFQTPTLTLSLVWYLDTMSLGNKMMHSYLVSLPSKSFKASVTSCIVSILMGLALWTTFLAYSCAISLVVLRQLKALPTSIFPVSFLVVLRKIYRLSNHNLFFISSGSRSSLLPHKRS